jgi:hypothetical protein
MVIVLKKVSIINWMKYLTNNDLIRILFNINSSVLCPMGTIRHRERLMTSVYILIAVFIVFAFIVGNI